MAADEKATPAKARTPVEKMNAPKNIVLFLGDGMGKAIRYAVGKNKPLRRAIPS